MNQILSVSEVNRYIKEIISRDLILGNIMVRGELSNYIYHSSGHMYFSLKDESGIIKCVMFKASASHVKFKPESGMKVIIKGYISVFERDGIYQLYAEDMQPDGIGSLHIAFEQLKAKLASEGLFDVSSKKSLPFLPQKIAVVTSPTGAVIKDIMNVLFRRFPNIELMIFPTAVQGETAAGQIVHAIEKLNELNEVDVIIVARGGGSLEDLWPFNEEKVARSIYSSSIPIISAVGHETDFTICDFVADFRAPTPSVAAEIVIQEKQALLDRISADTKALRNLLIKDVKQKREKYQKIMESYVFKQPFDKVYQERQKLDSFEKYLNRGLMTNVDRMKAKLGIITGKLDVLSPLTILSRGYSVAVMESGRNVVRSYKDVKKNDKLEIIIEDGFIGCTVNTTRQNEGGCYGKEEEKL
ncbi:MAG: exodeoxyribonuclease VII large subunit [Clostridia bacterium]|jgi:exodeoxyribonuclease VII large subunit